MVASFGHIPATQFEGTPALDLKFPALPRTVAEVPRLVDRASSELNIEVLAEIVEADPVVAPAVMRRINSAYYGLRRRVDHVRQAVALLGFLEVTNIALTSGLMRLEDVISGREQADIFHHVMRLGVGASFYARHLADHLQLSGAPQLATVSLFHGLGRLVLLHNRPDDYEALWFSHDRSEPPRPHEERAIFGTDHPTLSAYAANQWHFPESVELLLANYATPEELDRADDRRAAHLVAAAVYCAQIFCVEDDSDELPDLNETPVTALAVALGRDVDALGTVAYEQRHEAQAFVNMMLKA